jgi:hypothetical protein
MSTLDHARHRARQARVHAFGVAGAAAWASALAGGRSGREAAWACAGAAVWAAARVAIGDIAGDRARAAARATAGDAAAIVVRRVRLQPGGPPLNGREAVAMALQPALAALADSAVALLDRMLPTEPLEVPAAPVSPTLATPLV